MDHDEQRDSAEEASVLADDQAEREAPVFAYINITTADGELVERIECLAWEYEAKMSQLSRRLFVPVEEIADALHRTYTKYDESKPVPVSDERRAMGDD